MDKLSGQQRHKNMVANKSRGTRPELLFGKLLWNAGVRYRKNDHGVKGTPDFTVRKYRSSGMGAIGRHGKKTSRAIGITGILRSTGT